MRFFLIFLLASLIFTAVATSAPTPDGKFVFRDGQWIFVPADQSAPLVTPPQSAKPPVRDTPEPPKEPLPLPAPPVIQPPPAEVPSEPAPPPAITQPVAAPPVQKSIPVIEAHPVPPAEKPAVVVPPLPDIQTAPPATKPVEVVPPPAVVPPVPPVITQPMAAPPVQKSIPVIEAHPVARHEKPAAIVPPVPAIQPAPPAVVPPAPSIEKPIGVAPPLPPPSELPPLPAIVAPSPPSPVNPSGPVPPMPPTGVVRPLEPSLVPPPTPGEKPAEPVVAKPVESTSATTNTVAKTPAASSALPAVARGPVIPANPVKPPSTPGIQAAPLKIEAAESPGVPYRTREPQIAADEADKLLAALKSPSQHDSELIHQSVAAYRAGHWTESAKSAAQLLKTAPHSPCAEAAKWLQAEAIFADGDLYAAFETYEEFIKSYAGSTLLEKAMRREMETAEAFLTGTKRRLLGIFRVNAEDEGLAILDKVYDHRPTGGLAPDALFRRGEFQMQKKKYDVAEESFRKFAKEFPNHPRARAAELLAAQAAINYNMGPVYGDASLKRADDLLAAYRDKNPDLAAAENVPQALEKIRQAEAQKKYEVAAYYLRAQKPRAAVFYARRVIHEYPETPAENLARALLKKIGASVEAEQGEQP